MVGLLPLGVKGFSPIHTGNVIVPCFDIRSRSAGHARGHPPGSWVASVPVPGQQAHGLSQFGQIAFERLDFGIFLLHHFVQSLDRRQRHTIGVHGGNVFVVGAESEGSVEILGHRTDMRRRRVALEIPTTDPVARRPQVAAAAVVHDQRLVAAAEQVAGELAPVVLPKGIAAQQSAHPRHQVSIGSLDHQISMVPHQSADVHLETRLLTGFSQALEEFLPIDIIVEDGLPPVTPARDVAHGP